MQAEEKQGKNKKVHNRKVWTWAGLLSVLVIATTAVVGICLYAYTSRSDCEISLYEGVLPKEEAQVLKVVPEDQKASSKVSTKKGTEKAGKTETSGTRQSASTSIGEEEQSVWSTETPVDIFHRSYTNKDGEVSVVSGTKEKVIAPGTDGSYTFTLKNTGKRAVDYKVWIETKVSDGLSGKELNTKMTGKEGWLLGGSDSWGKMEQLNQVSEACSLEAGKSTAYTISWQWPFEQEMDDYDTDLGNRAVDENLTYTVTIHTITTVNTEDNQSDSNVIKKLRSAKTGDTGNLIYWIVFAVVSLGVILFLVFKRKNERNNERKQ